MRTYNQFDIIVFDMEDALIDQRRSLCAAVGIGIETYLVRLLGIDPDGGPLFSSDEIKEFQRMQGSMSDLSLMKALLLAALHWLPSELSEEDFNGLDGRDLLEAVAERDEMHLSLRDLAKRKNMAAFNKMLRSKGGGEKGLSRVRGLRNRWMALSEGHVMMDNYVKRILREAYLGDRLFRIEYGQERQFVTEPGAIDREESWHDPHALSSLRKRCPLAAVTRRSQSEAQYVLDRLEIRSYMDAIVGQGTMGMGMADPQEARWIQSLGVVETSEADYSTKVTEAIERIRGQEGMRTMFRVGYVGDCTLDNRGLVNLKGRYRLTTIGCAFSHDRKMANAQREKGADMVVSDPKHMVRILTERPRHRSRHRRYRR